MRMRGRECVRDCCWIACRESRVSLKVSKTAASRLSALARWIVEISSLAFASQKLVSPPRNRLILFVIDCQIEGRGVEKLYSCIEWTGAECWKTRERCWKLEVSETQLVSFEFVRGRGGGGGGWLGRVTVEVDCATKYKTKMGTSVR